MSAVSSPSWRRPAVALVLALVLLTPVFGWASGAVGYAEPLEHAAAETGAADAADPVVTGPLPDYAVPGLGAPLGTLASALVGTVLTLLVALGIGRLLER